MSVKIQKNISAKKVIFAAKMVAVTTSSCENGNMQDVLVTEQLSAMKSEIINETKIIPTKSTSAKSVLTKTIFTKTVPTKCTCFTSFFINHHSIVDSYKYLLPQHDISKLKETNITNIL